MRDHGLLVDEVIADGRFHHVKIDGSKAGKKSGTYICSQITLKNGDVALVGAFWNWRASDEKQVIKPDAQQLSADERAELEAARRKVLEASEQERKEKAERAKALAGKIWQWGREDRGSKYLWRKKVAALGVRVDRHGAVLVPVKNWDGDLVGLQVIPPEPGEIKKFLTGTPKMGCFHAIPAVSDRQGPLAFVEGYATGASVHMATGFSVVVCFDAGNLETVVREARRRSPERVFIVCGDDDHEALDQNGKPDNKGRKKATAAAKAARAHLVFPKFWRSKGQTDFNDLHVAQGIEEVGEQIRAALQSEPVGGDPVEAPPPSDGGGPHDFSLGAMIQRYTLIYRTTTAYDHLQRQIIGLTELRAAAGNKMVNRWAKHPERRMVNPEDVVFDPTERCEAHQVNLFRGMPMVPKAGTCDLLMAHLYYLCGESENVTDWVLKWIAYPLQNVGAKMETALIFHGPEGTGKNLFWSCVRRIYGLYGVIITQSQLESRFNGWASSKLFVIGNEVVPRQELYASKGIIKNMITEPEWQIEEKHMPSRTEANHANFVFLSNVLQPVTPDPDDRRYMVIWTGDPLDAGYYKKLGAEIDAGGIEAFYDYLVNLDLGDFNRHAKPLATEAKDRLIEISMDSSERFWRQWSAGDIKWPYTPAPTMVVYAAYKSWCERRGEKPLREVVFCAHLHRRMLKLKKYYLDPEGPSATPTQRWFFLPKEWRKPDDKSEAVALGECLRFFRDEAREENYAH